MKLIDAIISELYKHSHDDSECLRIKFENVDKLAQSLELIAEQFGKGYAEWYIFEGQWITKNLNSNELLEIYKNKIK